MPFEAVSTGGGNDLQVGGTAAVDLATITQLAANSYRVNLAGQTRDFQDIDNVLVHLSNESDTLVLAGGIVIDLPNLSGVEVIDITATTLKPSRT